MTPLVIHSHSGRMPARVVADGWLTRDQVDAQPWCKRCEKHAKAAGVIA